MSDFWRFLCFYFGVSFCIRGFVDYFYVYDPGWWIKILFGVAIIYLEIVLHKKKRK